MSPARESRGETGSSWRFKRAGGLDSSKTNLPLVVGFGISSPEQVSEVAKVADGVVVGSALVNCIPKNLDNHTVMLSAIKEKSKN